MAPKRKTTRLNPDATPTPVTDTHTTTSVTNAQIQAMINEGVTAALAARDATRNGDDSHTSGTGARRPVQVARECTYPDFLKCQPLNFKGTEGVVGLTQWFEKMESVYSISNCTVACQVKFATCTLQGNALTWWNSHVKTTTPEAAHAMPWRTLKKMMTDKYCPRGEIKKLEFEMWNLKVKGTDVVTYSQRFQELALMCDRMFPEEIDQKFIEFATELMDKKINTWAERQADNKRKSDDTARNNQNQQPNKRQNTRRAYAAGNGDRRPYGLRAETDCVPNGHFKKIGLKFKNNNTRGIRVGNVQGSGKVYVRGNAQSILNEGMSHNLSKNHATKDEDKSKGKRHENVPVVPDFLKFVFPENLPGIPPTISPTSRVSNDLYLYGGGYTSSTVKSRTYGIFSADTIYLMEVNGQHHDGCVTKPPKSSQIRAVAYKLELLKSRAGSTLTFHVSNLNKCYSDDPLVVPLEGLQVDDKLYFVEEPVEIIDREVKQLRRSRVPIVKVRWNSRRATDLNKGTVKIQFRKKYPHLFTKTAPTTLSSVHKPLRNKLMLMGERL
ncbi:reverse transcriptase domain-containing protein [Tanacetum coccineum]